MDEDAVAQGGWAPVLMVLRENVERERAQVEKFLGVAARTPGHWAIRRHLRRALGRLEQASADLAGAAGEASRP